MLACGQCLRTVTEFPERFRLKQASALLGRILAGPWVVLSRVIRALNGDR